MKWEPGIDVGEFCTPIDRCVCIETGAIDPLVVGTLEKSGYDYAPVRNRGSIIGLIETWQLRAKLNDRPELEASDQAIAHPQISSNISIDGLLDGMSRMRVALVTRGSDAEHHGERASVLGLITTADLNQRPLRTALYRILAWLEEELAQLIGRHFPDPPSWLKILSVDHRAPLIGYWELSKQEGVDISPIAWTTLPQLLKIVGASKDLRHALGFETGNSFDKCKGSIPDLRNRVMHPVRPLIRAFTDVPNVRATLQAMVELGTRVERLNEVRAA